MLYNKYSEVVFHTFTFTWWSWESKALPHFQTAEKSEELHAAQFTLQTFPLCWLHTA